MSLAERELPVELERKIFEIAAQSNSKFIPTLLLVAHRRGRLYDPIDGHVRFDPVRFGSAIQSQTISEHVKNLFTPYENFLLLDLDLILASCSAAQNLVLFPNQSDLFPFLSTMPLQRLSTALTDVFSVTGVDFTHPLFSRLTHLELMDTLTNAVWEEWKGLTLIPNLTHLAFLIEKSLAIFQGVLAACPALQVLVSFHWGFKGIPYEGIGLEPLSQDTRFIGARGGDDFWVRAEKFIAQRVSGQVDRGTFVLQEQ
ncbi:hypothetical protein DFH08DRAFT_888794 [Mycena albidolilacea]|uniref:Uncharacterized protein n=1 Tax=Mycena albidolilacea TaxID=1033008 RepID=A0AAD7EHP7_9AGAR|nr:hypothetical protein DFH08DRAFT_888794 [Mycena albidolilacea]